MGHWIVVNEQAVNLDHFVSMDIGKNEDGSLIIMAEMPATIDIDVELDGEVNPPTPRTLAITGPLASAVLRAISSMPEGDVDRGV